MSRIPWLNISMNECSSSSNLSSIRRPGGHGNKNVQTPYVIDYKTSTIRNAPVPNEIAMRIHMHKSSTPNWYSATQIPAMVMWYQASYRIHMIRFTLLCQ